MERNVRILGTGKHLPETLVTSEALDERIGVPSGTVARKSGVRERRHAVGETTSQMGAKAARAALDAAGVSLDEIDLIVCASSLPEQPLPCNAALLQRELGVRGVPCFDVNATCLSFVTALDQLSFAIAAGQYERVLLVSSESPSVVINWRHLESASLLGDGAAAAVLGRGPAGSGSRILASRMETWSDGADQCAVRAGGTKRWATSYRPEDHEEWLFSMNGPQVFRTALEVAPRFMERLLRTAGRTMADVRLVVPHQASGTALALLRRKLEIPDERWMDILADHGNCAAASIPMALHEAVVRGRIRRGDLVMLSGTSAGFSIGGVVLEY